MPSTMTNLWPEVSKLLSRVERPSRYIGSEWTAGPIEGEGSIERSGDEHPIGSEHTTDETEWISFCMAYPDTYEIGQPNQAVRILVNAVDSAQGMRAERAYLPAADMIDLMREAGVPAFSLESCAPLSEFDVIGITLPHELCATNVLELIDLAGIPLRSSDREESHPLVIGGGPCACNPEPFAPFFDAIMIGEGEESLPELLDAVRSARSEGASREELLIRLAALEGIYVPYAFASSEPDDSAPMGYVEPIRSGIPKSIRKRVFEGFSDSSAWEPVKVPFMGIVHDRLNVEILRGCARGCRFCQGGMMYRPVRERSADDIVDAVLAGLEATGYEEVSLTSLSSTDHSQIEEILSRLNAELSGKGVRITVPSQRLDSFGVGMASLVAGRKKGGLTFAPEAGTQRLRDAINKNITEEDLMAAIDAAMEAGWTRMKLYFMIGLPTETDDDVAGIAEICNRAFERMRSGVEPKRRGNLKLSVSVNVFVPKAQTPFQWDGQIHPEEARRRVRIIKEGLRYKPISISYHEPVTSRIEAVMSRGGRGIADLVELAWRKGARFDAWSEHFDPSAWDDAASALDVDMDALASATYEPGTRMPWSHVSYGPSEEFLALERDRAEKGLTTVDCTFDGCTACDACPSLGSSNVLAGTRS